MEGLHGTLTYDELCERQECLGCDIHDTLQTLEACDRIRDPDGEALVDAFHELNAVIHAAERQGYPFGKPTLPCVVPLALHLAVIDRMNKIRDGIRSIASQTKGTFGF